MNNGLPQGWAACTLGDVVRIQNGYAFPSKEFQTSGIPVIRQSNLAGDRVSLARCAYLDPSWIAQKPDFALRKNDVLIGMSGSVGKLCIYDLDRPALQNQRTGKIVPRSTEFIDWRFVWEFLKTIESQLLEKGKGMGVLNVSAADIESLPFSLPPLNEQRRIVAKLEKLLGKVDVSQQRLAKIPVLLKRFRQSVLAAACSGRLTADWREENRNVPSATTVFPTLKDSADLPETWTRCSFGDYVENSDGKRIPISAKEREKRKGSFPYYGASGVIDSIDGFTHDGEFLLIGEDGANLLSRSTPIAFLASGKIWVNNHAHVLRCKHGFPNAYLGFYINSIDLAPYVSGTAQPKLNQANMNTVPVPVPPFAEQKEIVRRVEELFALADQIEVRYAKAKAYIDNLTQSILAKAFRGELVPQDPNDEPASVLLERIKQQRDKASSKRSSKRQQAHVARA